MTDSEEKVDDCMNFYVIQNQNTFKFIGKFPRQETYEIGKAGIYANIKSAEKNLPKKFDWDIYDKNGDTGDWVLDPNYKIICFVATFKEVIK